MTKEAEEIGANAIISERFMTSMIANSMVEIGVYGTAVKIRKK